MIMKNFKFLYLLLAVVGVVTFAACTNTEEWTPGAQDKNAGVYFPNTSVVNVTAETTEAFIAVKRSSNIDEALTVSVRSEVAENAIDILSVDSSVTFDAGKDETTLKVTISNAASMVEGKKYIAKIKLDGNEASIYGASEVDFVFMIPEKWVDFRDADGKVMSGLFIDDFFTGLLGYDAGYAVPVTIQKHETDANRIRVYEPFGKKYWENLFGEIPGFFEWPFEGVIEFNITDPDNVIVVNNPVNLGISVNFSDIGLAPLYLYVASDENGQQIPGAVTYKDGIIQFAKDMVAIVYEYEGALDVLMGANSSGQMAYVLPGVEITDYAMAVEYDGMKVAADNKTTSAVLNFYYGADVDTFKFTVLEGTVTDVTETVAAIVAGSEDIKIYEGNTEEQVSTFEVALANTGMYTVVAVPYSAEGEAREGDVHVYSFYFPGLGASELPEVDIKVAVNSVVGITGNPAYEANYPSATSMCIYMEADGTQLRSITAFVGTGVPAELTNEEILTQGQDFSDFIPEMIEQGYALAVYQNLTEGTPYDVVLGFETIYGELKTFRTVYTPTAATPEEGGDNEGGEEVTPGEGNENPDAGEETPGEGNENPDAGEEEEPSNDEEAPAEPARFQFRTFTYSAN